MKGNIVYLTSKQANDFLLPRHYSGRKANISQAWGWYSKGDLKVVCTFGKPASPQLCFGVCGPEYSSQVYELNRLCRVDGWSEPISQFVGACLRMLSVRDWIIVSYSDSGMEHKGYIYQATNFLYTGITKQRTDKYTEGNKHPRHYDNYNQKGLRKVRSAKHRYIYFCTKKRKLKKEWREALNYPVLDYPKGDNKNYVLGEYLKPTIIRGSQ